MSSHAKGALPAILTILLLVPMVLASAQPQKEVRELYREIAAWEKKGANLTDLVLKLNEALSIIQGINSSQPAEIRIEKAEEIINEVRKELPIEAERSIQSNKVKQMMSLAAIVTSVFLGVIAYFYLPRLFWRLWVRARWDWKLSPGRGGKSKGSK